MITIFKSSKMLSLMIIYPSFNYFGREKSEGKTCFFSVIFFGGFREKVKGSGPIRSAFRRKRHLTRQILSFSLFAFRQQFSYFTQIFVCTLMRIIMWLPGPQCFFIKLNPSLRTFHQGNVCRNEEKSIF